jgi:phosphomannomutase
MQRVRGVPPVVLGGVPVSARLDLLEHPPPGPAVAAVPADLVVWELADGARVVLRPSGTEPKLKVYLEVVEPVAPTAEGYRSARAAADRRLAALRSDLDDLLLPG